MAIVGDMRDSRIRKIGGVPTKAESLGGKLKISHVSMDTAYRHACWRIMAVLRATQLAHVHKRSKRFAEVLQAAIGIASQFLP